MKNGSFCTVTFKNKKRKGRKSNYRRRLPASQYRRNNKIRKITTSLTLVCFSGKDHKCTVKPLDDRFYWQIGYAFGFKDHKLASVTNRKRYFYNEDRNKRAI